MFPAHRPPGFAEIEKDIDTVIAQRRPRKADPAGESLIIRNEQILKNHGGITYKISWLPIRNPLLLLDYEAKKADCLSKEKLMLENQWVESQEWGNGIYTGCVWNDPEESLEKRHGWGVFEHVGPSKMASKSILTVQQDVTFNYIYVGEWIKDEPHGNNRIHLFRENIKGARLYKYVWVTSIYARFTGSLEVFEPIKTIEKNPDEF